jgi:hypothetical protein
MSARNKYDLESQALARRRAVAAAEAILRGDLGVIEGARQLSTLSHDLVDDWTGDPDFLVFGALDTETDHLPVGKVRELWDPAALREKDSIVRRIEADARSAVEQACRNIVTRFRDV